MPTNPTSGTPPKGGAAATESAAHMETMLFQSLLGRVRTATGKGRLLERSETALRLILNRDSDRDHLNELMKRLHRAVETLPDDPAQPPPEALATAVASCLEILDQAEHRRLATLGPADPHAHHAHHPAPGESVADLERMVHARHRPAPKVKQRASSAGTIGMVVGLLAILGIGLAIHLNGGTESKAPQEASRPLVVQIEGALHGSIPGTNLFGGSLRVTSEGGRYFVTVTGIPAGECVLAGWDLVRKGVVTVNGTTPARVSVAKLNDLCHEEDLATMRWSPKEGGSKDGS